VKANRGQVAVYLALVLVAIAVLTLMNVGTFLGVRARNYTMNSGDAAALAVARRQGHLINRIGKLNEDHLHAALKGDSDRCEKIVGLQLRLSFLEPVDCIGIGNEAAKKNGCDRNDRMKKILSDHVRDVRMHYVGNPDVFPEPWEGAWEEYARRIETAISGGIWAGPDNIEFLDVATGHLLLNRGFYQAIAGRNWCWFRFNAPGVLGAYSSFGDWAPLPSSDEETRRRRCVNSEIYSLNLDMRTGSAVHLIGLDVIRRITGKTTAEIMSAPLMTNTTQRWFFYDTIGYWRKWREIDPSGETAFPAMGRVKPEYDVRGCAAVCRTSRKFATVVDDSPQREAVWSAAAKPFGTVKNEYGALDVVTSINGFVTDAFTDVRLVPLDTVGGNDLATADPDWMEHVKYHLPVYLRSGPDPFSPCWYCARLAEWENPSLREDGDRWLRHNAQQCVRPSDGIFGRGGSAHGH